MRPIWVVLLVAAPGLAQFTDFAATDDGKQVYFSTPLARAGEATPSRPERRVFRIAEDGLSLFAERGALANPMVGSSGDGAVQAQVSGDGRTVGYTLVDVCPPPGSCIQSQNIAQLRGLHAGTLGQGQLQLSRNGRWALLSTPGTDAPATLMDLESGATSAIPRPATDHYAVASDGTVLVRAPGPALWRAGVTTRIALSGIIAFWALSDNARIVIYTEVTGPPGNPFRLMAHDLATGNDTELFASTREYPTFLAISNDGRRVLYRVNIPGPAGTAYVADTQTGQSQRLPVGDGEQVSAGTLSGDGGAAIVATTAKRIVKFTLADGVPVASQELVPATPYTPDVSQFVPGSLVWLSGLDSSAGDLSGRILLDGKPLPVLSAAAGTVAVQVPWEQPTGKAPFRLDVGSESPFQQNQTVTVMPMAPQFAPAPGGSALLGILAIKGDFSGLITGPPGPGDVVVTYMTGLGAVLGVPVSGLPAPNEPLMPVAGTLRCRFAPQQNDAETLFAGLAPGMIGIYQVTFRMPPDAGGRINGLACSYQNASGGVSWAITGLILNQP